MTKKISPVVKALKKILKFTKNGKLRAVNSSGCVYHNEKTGRFCAVGCLLPKKTLALVKKKGLNEATDARTLYRQVKGLEKIIGLTTDQASLLQEVHDGWANGEYRKQTFINKVQKAIDKKTLMGVPF